MGRYIFRAAITTDVPPPQLWLVLDDIGRWPNWMPGFQGLRVELPPGPPDPGYRFRLRGALIYADLLVEARGPLDRTTSFRLSFPSLTGSNRCHVAPLPSGSFRLERTDALDIPDWLGQWLSANQRDRFERLAADFLTALANEARTRTVSK